MAAACRCGLNAGEEPGHQGYGLDAKIKPLPFFSFFWSLYDTITNRVVHSYPSLCINTHCRDHIYLLQIYLAGMDWIFRQGGLMLFLLAIVAFIAFFVWAWMSLFSAE